MIEEHKSQQAPIPPDKKVFAIGRMGLPLNLRDNMVCLLIILLAISLQIRLQNTLLGEGWFALLGFLGFIGVRYWLLSRRYPIIDDLEIDEKEIFIPACLNNGFELRIPLEDVRMVEVNIMKGRNDIHTSLVIDSGRNRIKINLLAVELIRLENDLVERNVKQQRHYWTPVVYFVIFTILAVLVLSAVYLLRLK